MAIGGKNKQKMKSMDIKHIGTLATGAVMLGAALAGPVGAGLDTKGLDKGYFYDGNFNPIVQIVVGEKGMATDAVAAGNIAATIGNLAYVSKTTEIGGAEAAAEGKVVISTAARGATGDYRQDSIGVGEDTGDFYEEDIGLKFEDVVRTYEKGDFTQYSIACDQQTRTEAGLLVEGSYDNIHCLFCKTLCLEALKNPSHKMKERITVDSGKIWYYESGLGEDESESLRMAIDKDAIKYIVETGYIPMKTITKGATADDQIDFEYRGKVVLFGEDYYVRDIEGSTKIYLSKAKVLDGVTSEGYTAEFNGYKFKIDHLIYSAEFQVAGILLNVEKPDGTIVQTQISKMANGKVDNLEISGVYAEEADSVSTASVIVYDTTTNVLLEDGEDLEMNGVDYKDWRVEFTTVDTCADAPADAKDEDCDISEYDDMDDKADSLLENIKITYTKKLDDEDALEKGESLNFPNNFKLTFDGFMTNKFRESLASGEGAGNIEIERGDDPYQIKISLTGSDGNRYNDVRLDEGPFKKNDLFIIDGVIYKYLKYEDEKNQAGPDDDEVIVTLDPQTGGSREKITFEKWSTEDNLKDDVTFRELALVDALDDKDAGKYENDANITLDAEDIFFKANAFKGIDVYFDDSDKTIIFSDDNYITIVPAMLGVFTDFDENGNSLQLSVVKETGVDASLQMNDEKNVKASALDLNKDGDDEDILVQLKNYDNEAVYIDFTDRNYDETDLGYTYDNSVMLTGVDITLDEDIDTLLITPKGDDEYTIDWGADNKIQSVELRHPVDNVHATYFIGTSEQETVVKSTVTKADEGKTVTAGCCSFTVDEFGVTAGEVTKTKVTQAIVNPIVGNLVVPEVGADTSKNLIIVGGPAVNGLSTVTKDDIAAASQKFIVKKDGNLLIVAGWTADDTVAAGNVLIDWLQKNVHA